MPSQEVHLSRSLEEEQELPPSQVSEVDSLLPLSVCRHAVLVIIRSQTLFCAQRSQLKPISSTKRLRKNLAVQKRDWAHVIDVNLPLSNFHELVPEMAHKVRLSSIVNRPQPNPHIVSFRTRHIPEACCLPPRAGRFCFRGCTHVSREDRRR